MSYKQAVLRNDPISFWPLSGGSSLRTYATLLLQYPTYQSYLDNESTYLQEIGSIAITDESNFGNHGAFTLGSPNFDDVTTLVSYSSNDTNVSGCKINSNIGINILNLYNAFQKGYEQQTFGIEFWLLMQNPTNAQSNIFDLHADITPGSTFQPRIQIYAKEDFIYFKVYFANNYSVTTKKQISSWDKPLHVFAVVKYQTLNIIVNGMTDESITIPNSYTYYLDDYTRFSVGPASSGVTFTINGLAFYDKKLSINEIRNHMFWAQRDSSPDIYSNQTNVSHFSFDNSTGQTIFSQQFTSSSLYSLGTLSNIITDGTGITLAKTTSAATAIGTWVYSFSVFSYLPFQGAEISWDSGAYNLSSSGRYAIVEVSYDNGVTYYQVNNGKSLPYFLSSFASSNSAYCLVKVTLYSPDTSTGDQPRIDSLNIKAYSSINELSDSGLFQIAPATNTSYMIKSDSSNILTRSKNLGIKFSAQDPGSNPGYANISQVTNSTYQTIEFWMEYDGTGSAVLDTGSVDLYIDGSNVLQNSASGSTLYVNGKNRNVSPITLTNGEVYHVVLVYPTTKSANIIINGSHDGSKTPSEASYGYITIYPGTLTSTQVKTRYTSFIAVQTGTVKDSLTLIGPLQEYSGTDSQVNNGQSIVYHEFIQ